MLKKKIYIHSCIWAMYVECYDVICSQQLSVSVWYVRTLPASCVNIILHMHFIHWLFFRILCSNGNGMVWKLVEICGRDKGTLGKACTTAVCSGTINDGECLTHLPLGQFGRKTADDIFKCVFLNAKVITWTNADRVHWSIYAALERVWKQISYYLVGVLFRVIQDLTKYKSHISNYLRWYVKRAHYSAMHLIQWRFI